MTTPDVWKLEFNDGNWKLITAPPILRDGTQVARMARAYQRELLLAIAGEPVWPLTAEEELSLFVRFRQYYEYLAEWALPGINPRDLKGESRHAFFIATESHPHPNPDNDEMVRGLSGIEQLLGYSYPEREPDEEPDEGAGDSDLSTLAIALLTFQHQDVLGMAQAMSSTDLANVVGYANRKLSEAKQAAEDKENGAKPRQPLERRESPADADDAVFVTRKAQIIEALNQRGVELPPGF